MQVPVYRQQRPEDSKIGTQSATAGSSEAKRGGFGGPSGPRRWDDSDAFQNPTTVEAPWRVRLHGPTLMSKRSGDCSSRVASPDKALTVWAPLHALCAVLSHPLQGRRVRRGLSSTPR